MKDFKKYFAELFGTFVLVFVGTSVATTTGNPLYTALAFAFVIVGMAFSIGDISGAQLNPAVSLGLAISKRISWKDFSFYVLFQVVGAFIASGILFLLFGSNANLAGNQVQSALDGSAVLGLVVEIIVTTIFVFVILSVTSKKENSKVAGFVIALTLGTLIMASFNLTSAGLNPARSLAPAVFEGGNSLSQVWVFILGPLVGSAFGSVLFKTFNK